LFPPGLPGRFGRLAYLLGRLPGLLAQLAHGFPVLPSFIGCFPELLPHLADLLPVLATRLRGLANKLVLFPPVFGPGASFLVDICLFCDCLAQLGVSGPLGFRELPFVFTPGPFPLG
jgi:hypothetical protein